MHRGVFVTGTDTNVGKTVAAAALMHRYRGRVAVRYWKPIQTGIETDDDTEAVMRLGACAAGEAFTSGVRLPRPVSPHLAARLAGRSIAVAPLVDAFRAEPPAWWVVEGAGGVLVPINDDEVMADLMAQLALPVLVVARTALGTINHTLLTLEALRHRGLPVAGVVLVGPADPPAREAIERHGGVPVVGELPPIAPLTADGLSGWATRLDPDGRLLDRVGR